MDSLHDALINGASSEELARQDLPEEYMAAYVRREDINMFRDVVDKDVRKSLQVGKVPMPEWLPTRCWSL